jgi:DNA-binding Lrp family transcriptional regulator
MLAMANAKKNITGTEELLKRVFETPEMDDVVSRMHRVQSGAKRPDEQSSVKKVTDIASDNTSDKVRDNKLSDTMSDGISNYPTDSPSDDPSDSPIIRPTVRPSLGTSHCPAPYPSPYPSNGTSVYPSDWKHKAADPIWALTPRQAKVLFFLVNQPGGIAQREQISKETGIPVPTVKHCIKVLSADGFISKPTKYVNRSYQGFSYTVNQGLCRQFIEKRGGEFSDNIPYPSPYPTDYPSSYPALGTSDGTSHGLSDRLSGHYSSSLKSNTTTDLETLLKTDPELGYWQEKGLHPQQVQKWMEETGMSQVLMLQSLKHCRFEMVDNDFEDSKPVQNVFNWFYKIIKKTGHYPKPANYKSWSEKLMEIEQALLEEQEAEVRRMEEFRQRKYKLEADRKFQEMMNDPSGETYKSIYERLSAFEKKLGEGFAFEKAMRNRYDELLAAQGE